MATVYRNTFTKPLPDGEEISTRKGERFARWKDGRGKNRTAPLPAAATLTRLAAYFGPELQPTKAKGK